MTRLFLQKSSQGSIALYQLRKTTISRCALTNLAHQLTRTLVERIGRSMMSTRIVVLTIERQLCRLDVGTNGRHLGTARPEEVPFAFHLDRGEVGSSVFVSLVAIEGIDASVVKCSQTAHLLANNRQRITLHARHQAVVCFVVFHNTPKFKVKQMLRRLPNMSKNSDGYSIPIEAFDSPSE